MAIIEKPIGPSPIMKETGLARQLVTPIAVPAPAQTTVVSASSFDDAPTAMLQGQWKAAAQIASRTTGLSSDQQRSLSEAYLTARNAGSSDQILTAKAIEQLFLFAPFIHGKSHEMPESETLLVGIVAALDEPQAKDQREKLHSIFRMMETSGASPKTDTGKSVSGLVDAGKDPEMIATCLNGTRHTAFLDDMETARALVSLLIEESEFLGSTNEKRDRARGILLNKIKSRIDTGEAMTEKIFRKLLSETGCEVPSSVPILMKSTWEFNDKVDRWGRVVGQESPLGCRDTLLRRLGNKSEIWVRTIDDMTPSLYANRLIGVVHEAEHSLQVKFNETLAGLAELRWRLRNYDAHCWIMAERMGLTIVQYLKALESWAYRHDTAF
jgi:hypothetical protein